MTKLYIANCTKFVQDFIYRLPEVSQLYKVTIPMGGQAEIYEDTDKATLGLIIDQYLKYGLVSVADLDRTKGYTGLCYQFDRPIDVERIMSAVAHNDDELARQGREVRKAQAAGISAAIDQNMQGSESQLQSLEVEIVEQRKPGENNDKMTETIQVAKPGSKSAASGAERAERNK
jgi:hypothetical protein